MTTLEQFIFYKNFAYEAFSYLSAKINKYVICTLEVDYADMVHFTYANIRKPNTIYIHIDNIVRECGNGYNKNKICSMIFIVLTHELMHVEQELIQDMYAKDYSYKVFAESAVEKNTLNFLIDHSTDIINRFGVNLDLSYYDINNMGNGVYRRLNSVELMYKYTIMNVIVRNYNSYKELEHNVLDRYANITIAFENGPNFLIKSNGEFCESILNEFVCAAGYYAGKYDRYTVNTRIMAPHRDKENITIIFALSDRQIYPMDFRHNF